jgi:hypothetical protein
LLSLLLPDRFAVRAFLERAGIAAGALEKSPGLYGVPLLADSFSPSDACHASPLSSISP